MRYITFIPEDELKAPKAVILIKTDSFRLKPLTAFYLEPLKLQGVTPDTIYAMDLAYNDKNKAPASYADEYLHEIMPLIDTTGARILYVADATYFKRLTKVKSLNDAYGYEVPCAVEGYEHFTCVYGTNYNALAYNEQLQERLDISITTLAQLIAQGEVSDVLGSTIVKFAEFPRTVEDVANWLQRLHKYKELAVDIETFSLRFEKAGIGTIGFAWTKHEGIAFPVDLEHSPEDATQIKDLLRNFFDTYKGKLKLFNCLFDITIIIYELYMRDDIDFVGMRKGISTFAGIDDVMFKAFLSLNSTSMVLQDLKTLAYPFTGAYAEDVNDITLVPIDDLLTYNLKDCLGTMYVDEVYHPKMVEDEQLSYYQNMLMPSTLFAYEMKLVGLPIAPDKVVELEYKVKGIATNSRRRLEATPFVAKANYMAQVKRWQEANAKRKKLIRPLHEYYEPMNTNSDPQIARLLYEVMGLPVLLRTPAGAPSTSSKIIKRLLQQTEKPEYREVLEELLTLSDTKTLISTFIPAFQTYPIKRKGKAEGSFAELADTHWLNGNIRLTGTQSGRMSGSEPNLTNLPSGSEYGKATKACFIAPKNWLFAGADFASLEDRVGAIRTQDPNKISIYTQGYCGHCLRAYGYYGDMMPLITDTTPEMINSIEHLYPDLRQRSKSPTFALQYQGTYKTLQNNLGFSPKEAKDTEAKFHEMYKVSKLYAEMLTARASSQGYLTLAFGLRLRTPRLHACKGKKLDYPAMEEGRSAYNADAQSWGLLTNRAVIELRKLLLKAPEYIQNSILILNAIHDASYYLVRDDTVVIKWLNDNLITCMRWNDDDGIRSTDVTMEANLDIGLNWRDMVTLDNFSSEEEIREKRETLYA